MQQYNVRESLPTNNLGAATALPQQMRKLEQLPACHHRNSRTTVEALQHVNRNGDLTSALLANIIGARQICDIDPAVSSQLRHSHHLITNNFQILDLQWQGAFQLEQDPLDTRYPIYLVLAGSLVNTISTAPASSQSDLCLECHQDIATIVNPGQKVSISSSSEGKALVIAIERDSIDSTLSSLLNRPLRQPAVFSPSIDLTSQLGQSLKKLLQFLWESTQGEGAATASLVMQKLEQAFLDCAVEGLPNNYTEELLYQTDGALACHVRKARNFIESHLHEDIKLGDIAAATQVCSRLLQKAFSHHCGCSPMRFLTQSRLQRIRQELEVAPSDIKIVDVMMQYGFTQGGKFAKEYQQLFGEKPSETLKRRRQFDDSEGESPLWQQIDDPRSARVIGGVSQPTVTQPFGSRLWLGWQRLLPIGLS